MPTISVNGVQLFNELTGETGPPVVFVHGAWGSHHSWDGIVPAFAETHQVLTYDRRGHSRSERPPGDLLVRNDEADLAALIEALDLAPAHVVGNSLGSLIAMRAAGSRPDLLRSLIAHEPSAFNLIEGDDQFADQLKQFHDESAASLAALDAGEIEEGTRLFIESVMGPGAWEQLPEPVKRTFMENAPAFHSQERDPDANRLSLDGVKRFEKPMLITYGGQSAGYFHAITSRLRDELPQAEFHCFERDGHVPYRTNPDEYVETVLGFIDRVDRMS
jgi:pimeloyl-ACP methyl ester carboxylesterase